MAASVTVLCSKRRRLTSNSHFDQSRFLLAAIVLKAPMAAFFSLRRGVSLYRHAALVPSVITGDLSNEDAHFPFIDFDSNDLEHRDRLRQRQHNGDSRQRRDRTAFRRAGGWRRFDVIRGDRQFHFASCLDRPVHDIGHAAQSFKQCVELLKT